MWVINRGIMSNLSRCVIDPMKRSFYLYSDQGEEKTIDCENNDEFFAVLNVCKDTLDDDMLFYAPVS